MPEVLIRTPDQDLPGAPFNHMLSSFAFPRGLTISQWPLNTFSHSFVLTSVTGVRSYGFVYAQTERVPDRTLKALKALVARATAKTKLIMSRSRRPQSLIDRGDDGPTLAPPPITQASKTQQPTEEQQQQQQHVCGLRSLAESLETDPLVQPSRSLRRMLNEGGSCETDDIGAQLGSVFFPATVYTHRAIVMITRVPHLEHEFAAILPALCHERPGCLTAHHLLRLWGYLLPHLTSAALRFSIRLKSNIEIEFDRTPFDLMPRLHVTPGLLKNCTPHFLVHLFSFLLNETKMIFVSNDTQYLSTFISSIVGLLYPFDWPHLYAPLLPLNLLDFFDAPMPFIVGVFREALQLKPPPTDAIVVDLDTVTFSGNFKPIVALPDAVAQRLCTAFSLAPSGLPFKSIILAAPAEPSQRLPFSLVFSQLPDGPASPSRHQAARTFDSSSLQTRVLECWTLLMCSFRPFLNFPRSSTTFEAFFARVRFMEFVLPSFHAFFEMFTGTQIFQQLVQSRTANFLQGEPPDFFDQQTILAAQRAVQEVQAASQRTLHEHAFLRSKRRRGGHRWTRVYIVLDQKELRKSSKSFDEAVAKKPCFLFDETARAVDLPADEGFYKRLKGMPDDYFSLRLFNSTVSLDFSFESSELHFQVLKNLQMRCIPKDSLFFINTHADYRFRRVRSVTEAPLHSAKAAAFCTDLLDCSLESAAKHSYSSDELIELTNSADALPRRTLSGRRMSWTPSSPEAARAGTTPPPRNARAPTMVDGDHLGLDTLPPEQAMRFFGRTRCGSVTGPGST